MSLNDDTETVCQILEGIDLDQPVAMLNPIRLRTDAKYHPSKSDQPCSGKEACERYRRTTHPLPETLGASVILSSERRILGPDNEWDYEFVARYPSGHAFPALVENPAYLAIAHHRLAAVEDSRLLLMKFVDRSETSGFSSGATEKAPASTPA